tara:strand:- start:434 stop:1162 length:729 start_codon:yes stop_codon:yes gene_type:complete
MTLQASIQDAQQICSRFNRKVFWIAGFLGTASLITLPAIVAAPIQGNVVEVANRPAFVQTPARIEQPAQNGQALPDRSQLRTVKPGRMQVRLLDGRSFRMGGNAVLKLTENTIDLKSGQLIAWINSGGFTRPPLKVKTRVATASIQGTTLFIDDRGDEVIFLSWEGDVLLTTATGQTYELKGGQVATYNGLEKAWSPPTFLTPKQAITRRTKSRLLNGFTANMSTMSEVDAVIQRVAGSSSP